MLATLLLAIPDTLVLLCALCAAPLGLAFGLASVQSFLAIGAAKAGFDVFVLPGRYRVARDGRAFVQIGRRCYFGRRGESHAHILLSYNLIASEV